MHRLLHRLHRLHRVLTVRVRCLHLGDHHCHRLALSGLLLSLLLPPFHFSGPDDLHEVPCLEVCPRAEGRPHQVAKQEAKVANLGLVTGIPQQRTEQAGQGGQGVGPRALRRLQGRHEVDLASQGKDRRPQRSHRLALPLLTPRRPVGLIVVPGHLNERVLRGSPPRAASSAQH